MSANTSTVDQRRSNIDSEERSFNVDICLKIKIESAYAHRRCFDIEKTILKQLCQYLLY